MLNPLKLTTWLIAGLFSVPLFLVFSSLFQFDWELWRHLASTVLSDYVVNSLLLVFGVGIGTGFIGTYLAWCMVHYRFIGKPLLNSLILLPLAMPAYIIAYTYTGLLDFSGPFQNAIRAYFGIDANVQVLPDIRNLGGAILMMILVLYPYVYLLARTAFKEQSPQFLLVSQLAGVNRWQHIKTVALPLAKPAILIGMALAMMEALADYGTVAYFGVSTFTTGIYRTWFGMGNPLAASQLASLLCLFVFVLLCLEKYSRADQSRFQSRHQSNVQAIKLEGKASFGMFLICVLPPIFAFVVPASQLFFWVWLHYDFKDVSEYRDLFFTSLQLAILSALFIVSCALVVVYCKRRHQSKLIAYASQFMSLGYAIPGVVIAVGVVQLAGFLDIKLNELLSFTFDFQPGLVISGGFTILIFAYTVRYLSVALHNTETGIDRIKSNLDEVSESLGARSSRILTKVHVPLLSSSLITASLLVFVDVLKELPATLILRPFNVNTLAVKAYELASDERLIDAALPAISIVLAGILPVIILTRTLETNKN